MSAPLPAAAAAGRTLLVMLHGAHFQPQDFVDQGFVTALHQHDTTIEAVSADLDAADYLEHDLAMRLHARVIAPALARGTKRLWLMGISLGGMGALLYARARLASVDGVILLSPFLATRGTIAEITEAGGFDRWRPTPPPPGDIERGLMAWIASPAFEAEIAPRLHLGYGTADRFAPASLLLAARLPAQRVVVTQGGHDWPTWRVLWHRILDGAPFAAAPCGRDP